VRLSGKPILFTVDVEPSIPNNLIGDETRVRQVLLNILSNAVKYTTEGSIRFAVNGERADNGLQGGSVLLKFEVSDSGTGIAPEDMHGLFEEFSRFDAAHNKKVEGTGLGLAIARRLCLAMGGNITASSVYGNGSTFAAAIPQRFESDAPMGDAGNTKERFVARFSAPDAVVLLVDDLPINLTVAKGLLAPYEMKVDTCGSGKEAVELVRKKRYDLVLMDHMMPGMDGLKATALIRGMKEGRRLPVIALTANAVSGMQEMFMKRGMNDFLSKPIDTSRLDAVLRRWIPREKQRVKDNKTPEQNVEANVLFEVEGIDAKKGMIMTGGTEAGYRSVLEQYCRDVSARVVFLNAPYAENNLKDFITHAHALKSASATIGAAGISAEAGDLEDAGKRGDAAYIRERVDEFRYGLANLAERVAAALSSGEDGEKAPEENVFPLLRQLKEALVAEDVRKTDAILAELTSMRLEPRIKNVMSEASELVLISEFAKAVSKLNELFCDTE
jgi:CheY-like chemotaxis protein/HPt (histidine-containing phosphotransfer) domain-containing protein